MLKLKQDLSMEKPKILYISQEISPYLAETPLSVLGRDLPQSVLEKGFEVRTFMPRYGSINERRNQLHEVIRLSGVNISIDDSDHPLIIKVATLQPSRMQVYFIDNDDYFLRSGAKALETEIMADDNDERMMFFVRGVLETVRKLRWDPAVIHCTGWISALAPMYVKHMAADDPSLARAKIVYSLRSETFDGTLDPRFAEKLRMAGFTDAELASLGDQPVDWKALNRLAIDHADAIVQSSEDVDEELIEYARKSGKPFLPYVGDIEQTSQAYADFYNSLSQE